jgi:hypothetical protein
MKRLVRYSLLSAFLSVSSMALTQLPSFAYTVDKVNHVVNVQPGSSPSATTSEVRGAVAYLTSRADKDTLWTLKFAPGKYIMTLQVTSSGLKNTILSSDPAAPAQIIKVAGWDSATSSEYLMKFSYANKVQLNGFEFYGQTSFANGPTAYWPDQGVYFGSSNVVKIDSNKFYNFGNSALRVVTDQRDPVAGVNSFKTLVSNNLFNNVYQTATTSTDKLHGGTAMSTWINNTFVNLRGSVKFASRTPGATTIEFLNNTINGGDHYGLEIDNYQNFTIKGNILQNIKQYGMTIYTNGDGNLMSRGFPWGDNFNISNNSLTNIPYGIRFDHRAFWDGTQNIPKNLVIDGNTFTKITNTTSYTPVIQVTGGAVNGVQITNNKMSQITNKKYYSVIQGSTNLNILNNTVDGSLIK